VGEDGLAKLLVGEHHEFGLFHVVDKDDVIRLSVTYLLLLLLNVFLVGVVWFCFVSTKERR